MADLDSPSRNDAKGGAERHIAQVVTLHLYSRCSDVGGDRIGGNSYFPSEFLLQHGCRRKGHCGVSGWEREAAALRTRPTGRLLQRECEALRDQLRTEQRRTDTGGAGFV